VLFRSLEFFFYRNNLIYQAKLQDGYLALLLTHKCNSKCKFCGFWKKEDKRYGQEMSKDFIFKQCLPLYKNIKQLCIGGGEITCYKYGLEFVDFISKNYPHITISTDSNCFEFNEQWRQQASDNLFQTRFSINASNVEIFKKGVWIGSGAETAYEKSISNLKAYVDLLEMKGLKVFAPSISMVINKDTAGDVYDFTKMALSFGVRRFSYFFDYTENKFLGDFVVGSFKYQDISMPTLKTLMEIERVLAKKIFVSFRVRLPAIEAVAKLQDEVDSISIEELRKKYKELLELAKTRDMLRELTQRNSIRKEKGRKELNFQEEYDAKPSLSIGGKQVCGVPYYYLDIMANGKLSFCCFSRRVNINYIYDKRGCIDWNKTLNSKEMILYRRKHYKGDYRGCQSICPANPTLHPIISYHKYGYDRNPE
jgi:hypothetical protein